MQWRNLFFPHWARPTGRRMCSKSLLIQFFKSQRRSDPWWVSCSVSILMTPLHRSLLAKWYGSKWFNRFSEHLYGFQKWFCWHGLTWQHDMLFLDPVSHHEVSTDLVLTEYISIPSLSILIPRAALTLNNDLATLDAEYNKLSECMASGERDGNDKKWLFRMGKQSTRHNKKQSQYNIRMFFVPKLIVSDFDLLSYLDNPIKIPGGLMSQRSWWKRRPLCPLVTVTPGVISNGRFLPNVQWIEIYTYAHLHAHMHDMPIIFACIYIDESFREMFRHACIRILGAPKWPKTKPRFGRVLKVHWRQNAWWMMCL